MEILVFIQSGCTAEKPGLQWRQFSRDMHICNIVFQNVVYEPPLCNVYYVDAAVSLNLVSFLEISVR